MRILVAGSAGQLAREIIAQARLGGLDVTAPDESDLDISDHGGVFRCIADTGPEVVINCAAYNDVDGAETRWEDAFMANGIGAKNLALACKRYGAALMHFSSDYVFDGDTDRPYNIADMALPISSYGQSKLLGEELIREHGDRHYIVRTSWLFGEGRFSFPLKLLEWASENKTLRMVDDQTACPTYTEDLAGAVLKLARTDNYGLYHVTNSGYCSKYEWAEYILNAVGWDGELVPAKSAEFNTPARRPEFSALDNFPLSQTIGSLLPPWQDATTRFLKKRGVA
jgi:dTDP-4-dehydrorhamnose reductase